MRKFHTKKKLYPSLAIKPLNKTSTIQQEQKAFGLYCFYLEPLLFSNSKDKIGIKAGIFLGDCGRKSLKQ